MASFSLFSSFKWIVNKIARWLDSNHLRLYCDQLQHNHCPHKLIVSGAVLKKAVWTFITLWLIKVTLIVNWLKYVEPKLIWSSPGLVVMGKDWCSRGRDFEFQHRRLDGHFCTLICCKVCLFEKTDNKPKRGRGWPIFYFIILILNGSSRAPFCLFSFFSKYFTE